MTSAAVVLEVGAKPNGQASCATDTFKCTVAKLANVDVVLPVNAMSGMPKRLIKGKIATISCVSPELDNANTTSCMVIIPKSP